MPRPGILPPTLNVRFVDDHVEPESDDLMIAPLFGSLWDSFGEPERTEQDDFERNVGEIKIRKSR